MTSLHEMLANASHCDTIALDQDHSTVATDENFGGQIRVTARDVTVDGGVDSSKPKARIDSTGLAVYGALGWKFRNIEWWGPGYGDDAPGIGCLLQMVGGSEWQVLTSEFHNSRAMGQLSVGDDNGITPTKWAVEHVAFFDNGSPSGQPGGTHSAVQEHMLYVVASNPRDLMDGYLGDLYFHNNYCGATVKLGGVDAWNGACRAVVGARFTFAGHHDEPLLFPGTVEVDLTDVRLADGADVAGSLTCNGRVAVNLHNVVLPGNFLQTCWPGYSAYETWWTKLLRCSPRILPTGTDSYQRRGEITWDGEGDNGQVVDRRGRPV